jgi:hypothetical protein
MFGFTITVLKRYPDTYVVEFAYSRSIEWAEVDADEMRLCS